MVISSLTNSTSIVFFVDVESKQDAPLPLALAQEVAQQASPLALALGWPQGPSFALALGWPQGPSFALALAQVNKPLSGCSKQHYQ